MRKFLAAAIAAVLLATPAVAQRERESRAQRDPDRRAERQRAEEAPLRIREIGSLHVGGRIAELSGLPEREITFSAGAPPVRINPNGQFQVEQMYAQYVRLQNPRARFPLILAHGGGLTGVTYETTPDGRPGW